MKTVSLILATIILCSFTSSKSNNSLSEGHLKGKVKSILECKYFIKGIYKDTVLLNYNLYDEMGNDIVWKDMGKNEGENYCTHSYKYDALGNKMEEVQYNKDGSIYWKKLFKYDKAGNLTEDNRYSDSGVLLQRNIYLFDSVKNSITEVDYDGNGWIYDTTTLKYDKKGNEIECYRSPFAWKASEKRKYIHLKISWKYDNNNQRIERTESDEKGQVHKIEIYNNMDLDKFGNWTTRCETIESILQHRADSMFTVREISYY